MRALEMEGGREEVLRGRGTSREARDGEEPAVVFEERAVEVARGAGRHPAGDEGLEALAVGVAEEVEARFLVEDEVVGGRGCAGGEEGPGGVEDGAESGGDALAVLGSGWEAPGSTKKAPRAARSASMRAGVSKDTLDPDNPGWPEEATLALTLPPIIENETAEAFRLDVAAELDRLEVEMIDVNSEGPGAWSQIVTILVR